MTNITPSPLDRTDKRPFFWDENKKREVFWPFGLVGLDIMSERYVIPDKQIKEMAQSRHEFFEAAIKDLRYDGSKQEICINLSISQIDALNKVKTETLFPVSRGYLDNDLKNDFFSKILLMFNRNVDIFQNIYFAFPECFVTSLLEDKSLRFSKFKIFDEKFIMIQTPEKELIDKLSAKYRSGLERFKAFKASKQNKEKKSPLVEYVEKWEALESSGRADLLIEISRNLEGKIPASKEWYEVLDKWSEKHSLGQKELGDMVKSLMELLV
ncbi:MAG: hypothetical protein EOM67_01595 [Spirochaetia bacterium]|nr:hypothetical protein [Spirochaetia bacterium]